MSAVPAIGILGGTFDPVHDGHLYIAQAVLTHLPIKTIRFIPCYQPVHRLAPTTSVEDRLAMLQLALKDKPGFTLDLREIERKGPSYMVDTLASLRQDYPDSPLCLILGSDAYQNISSWKHWQELLDYAHFVVINRNETCGSKPLEPYLLARVSSDPARITQQCQGQIFSLPVTPCPISATKIRHDIQNGLNIDALVPKVVADYIYEHHLYK
jgi:nicotinate-nucleotide adenylyltransferase